MKRSILIVVTLLLLAGCDARARNEMTDRSLAKTELRHALRIYAEYLDDRGPRAATKADLVSFRSDFPASVDFYPMGHKNIP